MRERSVTVLFLGAACLLLFVLWLPGIKYPIVSDAVHYGMLGRSLWEQGTYALNGVPYGNHLPLHALLSYPFTELLGFHVGMHVLSLLGGFGVLITAYFFTRKIFSTVIPAGVVTAIAIHPAFVLMSYLGSADLLFATLFLLSLLFFLNAEHDRRWYIGVGVAAGLASLTRYNGLPLFGLFLAWTAWKRRGDFRSVIFWAGLILGVSIFSLWLLRNYFAFGDPFFTGYAAELEQEAPNLLVQFWENVVYYVNPFHNVFPFFFVTGVWGLIRFGRSNLFLILAMLTGFSLSLIWWVQAIRFMFPGFLIFMIFAVLGLIDMLMKFRFAKPAVIIAFFIGLAIQGFSLCIYTYGECNARFDQMAGILPKNLGLTSEGFYAWHLARNQVNARAEQGAFVQYEFPEESAGIFRNDLIVTNDLQQCPAYRVTQRPEASEEVVYQTDVAPITSVTLQRCL